MLSGPAGRGKKKSRRTAPLLTWKKVREETATRGQRGEQHQVFRLFGGKKKKGGREEKSLTFPSHTVKKGKVSCSYLRGNGPSESAFGKGGGGEEVQVCSKEKRERSLQDLKVSSESKKGEKGKRGSL